MTTRYPVFSFILLRITITADSLISQEMMTQFWELDINCGQSFSSMSRGPEHTLSKGDCAVRDLFIKIQQESPLERLQIATPNQNLWIFEHVLAFSCFPSYIYDNRKTSSQREKVFLNSSNTHNRRSLSISGWKHERVFGTISGHQKLLK